MPIMTYEEALHMDNFYITPKEAVTLAQHVSLDYHQMGYEIRNEYLKRELAIDGELFAYGACFHAGVVEGMRRERAKQKGRKEQKGNPYLSRITRMLYRMKSDVTIKRIYNYVALLYSQEGRL